METKRTNNNEQIIIDMYDAFNERNIDRLFKSMHPEVKWPNGWEGGYVYGLDEVRDYWTRQWKEIDPIVKPAGFKHLDNEQLEVTVHQQVQDKKGKLLYFGMVIHTYQFENGRIRSMEIGMPPGRALAFAPMLYINDIADAMEFYIKAFDATVLRFIKNPNGKVHVAEMSIGTELFRMHEDVTAVGQLSPTTMKGTSVVIGLLVDDPDAIAARAVAAGGKLISPVKDYEYGYRQGTVADPFGHHWLIEKNAVI